MGINEKRNGLRRFAIVVLTVWFTLSQMPINAIASGLEDFSEYLGNQERMNEILSGEASSDSDGAAGISGGDGNALAGEGQELVDSKSGDNETADAADGTSGISEGESSEDVNGGVGAWEGGEAISGGGIDADGKDGTSGGEFDTDKAPGDVSEPDYGKLEDGEYDEDAELYVVPFYETEEFLAVYDESEDVETSRFIIKYNEEKIEFDVEKAERAASEEESAAVETDSSVATADAEADVDGEGSSSDDGVSVGDGSDSGSSIDEAFSDDARSDVAGKVISNETTDINEATNIDRKSEGINPNQLNPVSSRMEASVSQVANGDNPGAASPQKSSKGAKKITDVVGASVIRDQQIVEDTGDETVDGLKDELKRERIEEVQSDLQSELRLSLGESELVIESINEEKNIALVDTGREMSLDEFVSGITEEEAKEILYIQPDYSMEVSADSESDKVVRKARTKTTKRLGAAPTTETRDESADMSEDKSALAAVGELEAETSSESAGELTNLWGHFNYAANENGDKYRMDAGIKSGWLFGKGAGVTVAVLDTGMETTHQELSGRLANGWDFVNNDDSVNDYEYRFDQWHGTHVAATIAANEGGDVSSAMNEGGMVGVAPEANIMPLKVFQGGKAYTSDIIAAIEYAEANGADIVNCSFTSRFENPALKEAIEKSNMLFVCAAGNGGINIDNYPMYPASFDLPNIIAVSSIGKDGRMSRFSNYGKNSVDIAAPGVDIYSAWIDGEYRYLSGTSMATAYVSGVSALIKGMAGDMDAAKLKEAICAYSDIVTGLTDKVIEGSKLNAYKALLAVSMTQGELLAANMAALTQTSPERSVIDVPDGPMPVIIPEYDPEDEEYTLENAENSLAIKTSMPVPKYGHTSVEFNGEIYVIGGRSESGVTGKGVQIYNPKTDSWRTGASTVYPRTGSAATVCNGKIYIFGADNSPGFTYGEVYDPETDTWSTSSTFVPPISMKDVTATSIPGTSKIYILGSMGNRVFEFDTEAGNRTDAWTEKASLPVGITKCSSVYYKGAIYTVGGLDADSKASKQIIYNVVEGTSSNEQASRSYMSYNSSALKNNRHITAGGERVVNDETYYTAAVKISDMDRANDATGAYSIAKLHMSEARSRMSATVIGGKAYLIGGIGGGGATGLVEEFDMGWEEQIALPVPLKEFESVMLGGKLYIIGGKKLSGSSEVNSRAMYMYDPESKALPEKAQLPAEFYYISAASAYGKIYLLGTPSASSTSKSLYEYNAGTNKWTLLKTVDTVKSGISSVVFWNNKIYMITVNSSTLRTVVTYDPVTGTVEAKPNITLSSYAGYKAKPVVCSGELYFVSPMSYNYLKCTNAGGTDSWSAGTWNLYAYPTTVLLGSNLYSFFSRELNPKDSYYKFSIEENMRTVGSTFFEYKKIIGATAWNNKAFMFVNKDSGEYATHFTLYTPPDSIWQNSAPLSAAKYALGAAALEGEIYLAGGYGASGYFSKLDKYTPGTDSFAPMASMANARSHMALAVAGGKLYAIGGKNAGARALSYVEEYNPAANTWQTKAAIPGATANMAYAVYNGNIYIFGGNDSSKAALRTVRMYNPTANTWTTKTNMPGARYGAGAGTIGNKIYVAGGFSGGDDTAPKTASKALYVYDPVNDTWDSGKAEMPHPVGFAGSTVAGSLYMVGGTDGYNEIPLVFEYSPLLNKWFTWDGPNFTAWSRSAAISGDKIFVFGGEAAGLINSGAENASIESFAESYLHLGDETVNLTGNFARNYTDMEYKAPGFNVVFGRTYNSHDERDAAAGNVMGKGWTFGFQGSIDLSGNDAVVRLPNGGGYTFAQNTTSGVYIAKDSRMKLVKSGTNYIMTSPDQYTYEFNSKGKMTAMKDPYGNAITLTLDASGNVTKVTDQVGRISSIEYSGGKISKITDPAGRTVHYEYTAANHLRMVTDPSGYTTIYTYNDKGFLNKIIDNASVTAEEIVYEMPPGKKSPMVKSITDINGRVITYSYNSNTGMVSEKDQKGRESAVWYDRSIYPVRTKDAVGLETYTEYFLDGAVNRYGEVRTHTDEYGNITNYERDENGNITRLINPDNSTKVYTYNTKNMTTSEKNEMGRFTYYVYGSDGVTLSKEARPLNGTDVYSSSATQSKFAITSYSYETSHTSGAKGLLKTETNPEGGVTTYTYDAKGHMASVKTPRNITISYTNNIIGWLKTEANSKGTTYSYYDKRGNIVKTKYPDGGYERSLYNFRDQPTQKVNPEEYAAASDTASFSSENILTSANTYTESGKGTRYTYNTKAQMTGITDPMNNVTTYTYDIYGNINSETKPNGTVYYYEYDAMSRLKWEKFAESAGAAKITLAAYNYGAASGGTYYAEMRKYLTSSAYASTKMTYDFAGREVRRDDPLSKYTLKEYYPDGSLKAETDELGNKTFYAYDGMGLMSGRWEQAAASEYIYTGWEYDKCGRVKFERKSTAYTAQAAVPTTNMIYTEYFYNADGTISEKKTSGGKRTTYSYDNEGNVTSESLYKSASDYDYKSYTYNHRGQVLTENLRVASADIGLTGTGNTTLTTTNVYNKDGQLKSVTKPDGTTLTYARDLLGRELSVTTTKGSSSAILSYAYDSMGNKTSETNARSKTTTYTYNKRGFLTHITNPLGGVTYYEYDQAGRKVTEVSPKNYISGAISAMTRTTYTYDKMDRLTGTARVYTNDAGTVVTVQIASSEYDAAGNQTRSADKVEKLNGVYTIYEYDKAGRLTKTREPKEKNASNQVVYDESIRVWDAAGRIKSETDFNGYQTTYTYDADGNILSSVKSGVTTSFTWDKLGNKLSETDGNGNKTQWQYNAFGKVRKTMYPELKYPAVNFSDGSANKGYTTDPMHADPKYVTFYGNTPFLTGEIITINFAYGNGEPGPRLKFYSPDSEYLGEFEVAFTPAVMVETPLSTVAFVYNSDGMFQAIEGYELSASVSLASKIEQLNTGAPTGVFSTSVTSYETTATYTNLGETEFEVDNMGVKKTYTYDFLGNMTSTSESETDNTIKITKKMEYDLAGNMTKSIDENGDATTYSYDSLNRKTGSSIAVKNSAGATATQTTTYAYDADGNMTKETNWRGNAKSYTYDNFGRLTKITDPTNTVIETISYDNGDCQTSSTDALGNTRYYYYDFKGRLVKEKDALSHETAKTYDSMGNVKTEKDARNNLTSYSYNAFGKLLKVTNALSEETNYTYDNNGNMLSQTDAKGNKTTYYYTSHNQVAAKVLPGGISSLNSLVASRTEYYSYFANGLLAGKAEPQGNMIKYAYDIHGRLVTEKAGTVTSTFTYDAAGNKLTAKEGGNTITRKYDSLGRVISKQVSGLSASTFKYDVTSGVSSGYISEVTTDPKGNATTRIYDKAGRLYQVSSPGGNITYTYYANGNKKKISYPGSVTAEYTYYADNRLQTLSNKKGSTILEAYSYSYDADGNLISKTDVKGTTSYRYDALRRLEGVTEPGSKVTTYAYDGAGNRRKETIVTNGATSSTKTYQYNNMNQLIDISNRPATGVTINTSFTYDNNGNTIKEAEGTSITNYTYDARNRMISAAGGGNTTNNTYNAEGYRIKKTVTGAVASSTQYLYESDKVVLEMDASGGETGRNIYGDNTLLSRTASSTTLYYLYNGHGDVTALVNSSGSVVASYYYDAFGVITDETGGTTAANNSYRYSGYQYDGERQLYYLNARYYNPKIARFISQDTYTGNTIDPLSLNLYTYGYNNPIRYYDPTGHIVTEWDKRNCTKEQISTIEKATKDYNAAKAIGDQKGMNAAHAMAVNARAASGKMRNNQTVNSSGYVVMKTSGTASGSSGSTSSSNRSRSGSSSGSGSGSSKTSNNITASIKDNLSLKPLTASASSNHPLINGNQIAEKDTNKISSSEVGDGVFSFISGAASGVAASLSMGLSDIFVVKDDNKNETVYLVGRLVGAVVVAVVAVAVTVGSGAAAVGTSPTVVGSAVSAGSAINAGGKVVSAVGVAGDAVSTIIANNSGGSSGATRQLMFGANGVKVNSKTVWKGDNGIRLDVENPNPGQRPGQIHLQDAKGGKYMFDPDTVTFSDAPNWVNKLLKDSDFVKGMNKGLEKYLGEQGI